MEAICRMKYRYNKKRAEITIGTLLIIPLGLLLGFYIGYHVVLEFFIQKV